MKKRLIVIGVLGMLFAHQPEAFPSVNSVTDKACVPRNPSPAGTGGIYAARPVRTGEGRSVPLEIMQPANEKRKTTRSTYPVWQEEAEDALLSGTTEITTGCANASMETFVRTNNDAGNGILFSDIEIGQAQSYELVIDYFHASETRLELVVNDVSLGEIIFPAAQWCYQGPAAEFIIAVDLVEGLNKIELRVIGGITGPFVDQLRLLDPDYTHVPENYYISSSLGDDANDGLSPLAPFKTLEKISSVFVGPGDSILFKSGDRFGGQLIVNGSGNEDAVVYIGRYGQGENPILDGADTEGGAFLAAILIENNDFIEMRDLEITNDRRISRNGVSDALAYGIYVLNNGDEIMRHFVFKQLTIRDVFAISIEGVEFNDIKVAAIRIHSENNLVAGREKHIRDVLVDSCSISRTTRYGIFSSHRGGAEGVGNDSLNRNMNFVFRNNHFYQTGGSCITPGRTYNCLVEHNIFEYPGSDADPRMANRGSGAWFWNCRNVVAQYNRIYHVRGYGDSYGMHIDFGNENVVFQYNYSEDSEGGFVEILGDNLTSVYRFNVSVNDGFRDNKGNSLWVSDFAGTNARIRSRGNYIYNNSVYVDATITPDILITGYDTYVYNNIFYAIGGSLIGQEVTIDITDGYEFQMSNNLFFGNVTSNFSNYDSNPVFGDPVFENPGSRDPEGYRISSDSPALRAGTTFQEPVFPEAGKGIFTDVTLYPEYDLSGSPVNVRSGQPPIGAFNPEVVSAQPEYAFFSTQHPFMVSPNPVRDRLSVTFRSDRPGKVVVSISDLKGSNMQSLLFEVTEGKNVQVFEVEPGMRNGIYVISMTHSTGRVEKQAFVLYR